MIDNETHTTDRDADTSAYADDLRARLLNIRRTMPQILAQDAIAMRIRVELLEAEVSARDKANRTIEQTARAISASRVAIVATQALVSAYRSRSGAN